MKKLIAVVLILCLVFAGALTYLNRDKAVAGSQDVLTAVADSEEAVQSAQFAALDFDAIYNLYAPDTVIMTVNGNDVRWSDYCGYLYRNCASVENYFNTLSMYGYAVSWSDVADESGKTFAQYVSSATDSIFVQAQAVLDLAHDNGVELSEESVAAMETGLKNDIVSLCGEGATEEDFYAELAKQYMSPELYDFNRSLGCYSADTFDALYGSECENVSDETAILYLEDNGYMTAGHILFLTINTSTGEELDDATKAEKLEKAQAVYEELNAITDNDARLARFIEMKADLCEDGGKVAYPVAYVFQKGTMVTEFEDTVLSLGDYELSEPVKTSYGYHIIFRLPSDPDLPLYSSDGSSLTARQASASDSYTALLDAMVADTVVDYKNGFKPIELLEFVK